jgi:hypothetical protein
LDKFLSGKIDNGIWKFTPAAPEAWHSPETFLVILVSTGGGCRNEGFIYYRHFHYPEMLTQPHSLDEKTRKAIPQIARLLEDILQQVKDANAKLDHLIETYRSDRYEYDPCRRNFRY